MWIFTRYGFYSIAVANKSDQPGAPPDASLLMIRARSRAHIENLRARFAELRGTEIQVWPHRDYNFRILVAKEIWVQVIAELAREQTWSNFKNQVATSMPGDHNYNDALHEVWRLMSALQETS
jgi:hypothetical protein